MVERGADVLSMDPTKPVKQSAFMRADAAIRRMPGLGIIIAMVLLQDSWERGNIVAFGWLVIGVTAMLCLEFVRKPSE